MKKGLFVFFALCSAIISYGQNSLYDLSESSAFGVGNPARRASTSIDAVLYNPAGTAFLPQGLTVHFSEIINRESIYYSNRKTCFIYNGKEYCLPDDRLATKTTNVFPSFQVAYKTKPFFRNSLSATISMSASNEGGLGKVPIENDFYLSTGLRNAFNNDESSDFNGLKNDFEIFKFYCTFRTELYNLAYNENKECPIKGDDILSFGMFNSLYRFDNYGFRLGSSFNIKRMKKFSLYIGAHVNYLKQHYDIGDVKICVYNETTHGYHEMSDYIREVANEFDRWDHLAMDSSYQKFIENMRSISENYDETNSHLKGISNKIVKINGSSKNYYGVAPIFGLHWRVEGGQYGLFDVAATCEMGAFLKTRQELHEISRNPSLFAMGINWTSNNQIWQMALAAEYNWRKDAEVEYNVHLYDRVESSLNLDYVAQNSTRNLGISASGTVNAKKWHFTIGYKCALTNELCYYNIHADFCDMAHNKWPMYIHRISSSVVYDLFDGFSLVFSGNCYVGRSSANINTTNDFFNEKGDFIESYTTYWITPFPLNSVSFPIPIYIYSYNIAVGVVWHF